MVTISDTDYEHWLTYGYVVVRVLDDDDVAAALDNLYRYMPSWEEYAAAPLRYRHLASGTVSHTFPFVGSALNRISVHPELRAFGERVLGTEEIMMNESQLIGKYAGGANFEQELHVDYGNTTLAYPKADDALIDLPIITYYTDVTLDLGPTYVVPRNHSGDGILLPRGRSRVDYPDLYEHEIPVTVPAGSSLIYSMRTWHRGSAMTATEGVRYSHHMGFRRTDSPWCGQFTFVHEGGRPEMDAFLQSATPRERELLGFPPVGHRYWDPMTIAGVSARYPKMDMRPYLEGRVRADVAS